MTALKLPQIYAPFATRDMCVNFTSTPLNAGKVHPMTLNTPSLVPISISRRPVGGTTSLAILPIEPTTLSPNMSRRFPGSRFPMI